LFDVQSLGRDTFVNELRDSLPSADAREALIFVHGYNVSFEDAARRAAQISVDLNFRGRTLMFGRSCIVERQRPTRNGTQWMIEWSPGIKPISEKSRWPIDVAPIPASPGKCFS
jgi:hypothetical protein